MDVKTEEDDEVTIKGQVLCLGRISSPRTTLKSKHSIKHPRWNFPRDWCFLVEQFRHLHQFSTCKSNSSEYLCSPLFQFKKKMMGLPDGSREYQIDIELDRLYRIWYRRKRLWEAQNQAAAGPVSQPRSAKPAGVFLCSTWGGNQMLNRILSQGWLEPSLQFHPSFPFTRVLNKLMMS